MQVKICAWDIRRFSHGRGYVRCCMFVSTFHPLTSCVFAGSLLLEGGKPVACEWDDVNQGEAYAHTLAAFQLVCERGGGGR